MKVIVSDGIDVGDVISAEEIRAHNPEFLLDGSFSVRKLICWANGFTEAEIQPHPIPSEGLGTPLFGVGQTGPLAKADVSNPRFFNRGPAKAPGPVEVYEPPHTMIASIAEWSDPIKSLDPVGIDGISGKFYNFSNHGGFGDSPIGYAVASSEGNIGEGEGRVPIRAYGILDAPLSGQDSLPEPQTWVVGDPMTEENLEEVSRQPYGPAKLSPEEEAAVQRGFDGWAADVVKVKKEPDTYDEVELNSRELEVIAYALNLVNSKGLGEELSLSEKEARELRNEIYNKLID